MRVINTCHLVYLLVIMGSAAEFAHPGVMLSKTQLEYIRENALSKNGGDVRAAYQKALLSPFGALDYKPSGPPDSGVIDCGSYSHPDHGCSDEDRDASTAYLQACVCACARSFRRPRHSCCVCVLAWIVFVHSPLLFLIANSYEQALLFAINSDPHHASNAKNILDLYATQLQGYNNSNAPLQAAWSAMRYTKAAELLAHTTGANWPKHSQQRLAEMLTRVSLPLYYRGSPANGNWELSMIDAMMGISVLTDNRTLFDHAVAFWQSRVPAYFWTVSDGPAPRKCPRDHSIWNSSLCNPVTGWGCSGTYYGQKILNGSTDGICQETCRDFGHMSFGMASAHYAAETALIQGVDLWSQERERLAAASEFHTGWILTKNLTFGSPKPTPAPAYLCSGHGLKLADTPTFEVGYNALHNRLHMDLPNTEKYLETVMRKMKQPASGLIYMFETLTNGGHPPPPPAPPQ